MQWSNVHYYSVQLAWRKISHFSKDADSYVKPDRLSLTVTCKSKHSFMQLANIHVPPNGLFLLFS